MTALNLTLLPLSLMLLQHHFSAALAFQVQSSQPQIGFFAGRQDARRLALDSYKHKSRRRKYGYRGGNIVLSATTAESSDASSTLDNTLEKFAMPLEFKKGGGDVTKKDDATSNNDNNFASSSSSSTGGGDTGSKVKSSTPATDPGQSTTSSDKSVDADTSAAGAAGKFTPSADTPLANKYYLKKMETAKEEAINNSKKSETQEEKSSTAEITEAPATTVPVPVPVTAPRRRFDFGVASEVAEPTGVQDSGTSTNDGGSTTPTTSIYRGFTELSRPSESSVEGNEKNSASSSSSSNAAPAKENSLTDSNAKPAPSLDATKDDTSGNVQDAKAAVDTATKSPTTSTTKKENQVAEPSATASSSSIKKEDEKNASPSAAAESTTTKEKSETASSSASPSATCSINDNNNEECAPISTTAQPSYASQFSKLIQTVQSQPIKDSLTLSNFSKLDVEDFGLLPLVIIGISVYLALGIYLKQVNDTDDGYAGWDELGNKKKKEDKDEKEKDEKGPLALIQKVKDAGAAGAISYALWEAAFWGISIPVCLVGFQQATGHWPDLTFTSSGIGGEDVKQVGGAAFAFVNVARLAVPVRIGLALSTIPWVEENIVGKLFTAKEEDGLGSEQVMMTESFENAQSSISTGVDQVDNNGESFQQSQLASPATFSEEEIEGEDTSAISDVEERLNRMETQASRISSTTLENMNIGIDPTLLEYCEPGEVNKDCAKSILGYLDSLASTGAVATDGEVTAIVGYLDSLSSNVGMPSNENAGAAFTSYLDAISTGFIPAPSSAKSVANYLDVLSSSSSVSDDSTASTFTPPPSATAISGERVVLSKEQKIMGSRINEVEERLSRLESSVTSLPDDIASRLVDWQISQDKKMSDEMEKIMKLLVDGNSLEK